MRVVRSLSVAAVALATAFGGATVAQAATPSSTVPSHTAHSHPRTDAVTVPVQNLRHFSHLLNTRHDRRVANQTSTNWAGYASNGSTYTTVTSSWVQPQVSCTSNGIAAFWIGLDGWGSTSVEQDGTGADCSSGYPQYFAWWETYPANAVQEYSDPISAGDSFTSTVSSLGGGQYRLVLTDNTRGWTENNVVNAPSGAENASAEIVAEAVTSGSSVTTLPNFGSVTFTGNSIDGASLASANAQGIDMTAGQGGSVIAATGPYNGAGDFTVAYGSTTPPAPGGSTGTVHVTSPGNQSNAVGDSAHLQINGTDSAGSTLSYSATGLPPGTSISRSGLITGTLSTAGSYQVTVTATDSTGASDSASFTWTVGGSTPPTSCTGLAQWNASTAYAPGDVVAYDGHKYTSTWYSTGATPGAAGSWAVWTDDGAC